jgi:hypothetical protein
VYTTSEITQYLTPNGLSIFAAYTERSRQSYEEHCPFEYIQAILVLRILAENAVEPRFNLATQSIEFFPNNREFNTDDNTLLRAKGILLQALNSGYIQIKNADEQTPSDLA